MAKFPKIEEVEWIKVKTPNWCENISIGSIVFDIEEDHLHNSRYNTYKSIYENSKDFVITWGLKKGKQ